MIKKIAKIWSVGLTLALLASLLALAAPVAAAPGNMQFTSQPLPSVTSLVILTPSDITDIAVANDGVTVYVADSETGSMYRSSDGGQSFTRLDSYNNISGVAAPTAVAVAPDDPQVVAVSDGSFVYTSTNSGTTWSNLGTLPAASASGTIMDCAVGPARSGTLLGREYAAAMADPADAITNTPTQEGDVLIVGKIASWASAGSSTNITGDMDYMAVSFTPNFVGDRVLVAVGASVNSVNVTAGVYLHLINSATGFLPRKVMC